MKKLLSILLIIILLPLAGCTTASEDDGKIHIIATLFPQYDFARQIGGDLVEVTLLLPPGQESHLYDPSPSDMAAISKSDIFIFTGSMMEGWAGEISASLSSETIVVDASEGIILSDSHNHEHDGENTPDPHIWLDFDNAKIMCDNIFTALVTASPENRAYFEKNLQNYKQELTNLDNEYFALLSDNTKPLIFGGRFALGYLTERYSIPYKSAYASCSANSEPGVKDIKDLSQYIKDNNIKVVYCEEYSDPKVARAIIEGTDAEILVLHSAHNISREEREQGVTFISIMEQNLENIRKGLL